jgi:hypothetical protein
LSTLTAILGTNPWLAGAGEVLGLFGLFFDDGPSSAQLAQMIIDEIKKAEEQITEL